MLFDVTLFHFVAFFLDHTQISHDSHTQFEQYTYSKNDVESAAVSRFFKVALLHAAR
jgi:hypothetical protein